MTALEHVERTVIVLGDTMRCGEYDESLRLIDELRSELDVLDESARKLQRLQRAARGPGQETNY